MHRIKVACAALVASVLLWWVSGRIEVCIGGALAVLAIWWVVAGGVSSRVERWAEREPRPPPATATDDQPTDDQPTEGAQPR